MLHRWIYNQQSKSRNTACVIQQQRLLMLQQSVIINMTLTQEFQALTQSQLLPSRILVVIYLSFTEQCNLMELHFLLGPVLTLILELLPLQLLLLKGSITS